MSLNFSNIIKLLAMILKRLKELLMASPLNQYLKLTLLLLTIHLLNSWLTPDSSGVSFAIFSLIGSVFSGFANASAQEDYNNKMVRLGKQTNELNYKMNKENNEWNRQLAIDMFNMENAYNTPENQMARLKAAGINPYVAAGNVGNVEGRADTVPAQTPIPMQNPMNGTAPVKFDLAQNFAALAQGLSSVAQAKKAGMDTKIQEDAYNDIMRAYKADADYKEATARQAEMDRIIKWLYGFDSARLQVKNLEKDLSVKDADISQAEAHAKLLGIQYDIAAIEEQLKGEELAKFREIKPFLIQLAKLDVENAKKQGRVLDTQAFANTAAGNASNSVAALNNVYRRKAVSEAEYTEKMNQLQAKAIDLRDKVAGFQRWLSKNRNKFPPKQVKAVEAMRDNLIKEIQQLTPEYYKLHEDGSYANQNMKLLEQNIINAIKNNDWFEAQRLSEMFGNIVGGVSKFK